MNKEITTLPAYYADWLSTLKQRIRGARQRALLAAKGFSTRNLKYMKQFAQECPDFRIGQQSAAQLPWFHNPIGVAEYQLVRRLPEVLDTNLPSIEELETELSRTLNEVKEP